MNATRAVFIDNLMEGLMIPQHQVLTLYLEIVWVQYLNCRPRVLLMDNLAIIYCTV